MGKSYDIELLKEDRMNYEIEISHSKFIKRAPPNAEQKKLNEVIEEFYKQKASEKITKLVNKYSDIMKLFPIKLYFKSSKTKWASCSASNKISFNLEIIKLSSSLIKYVVIHELAHIQYKNHSRDFWNLVKKNMSDYQKKEEILRVFEKKL